MKFHSTRQQQLAKKLTVYHDGVGLVKEMRVIPANKEITEVEFLDISPQVDVASIWVDGLEVVEQTYQDGNIQVEQLLKKYIGEVVKIKNDQTDVEIPVRLLRYLNPTIAERLDTKEVLINPEGHLVLPSLPEGVFIKPSLVCKIKAVEGEGQVQLSYLTDGLAWQVTYVAKMNESKLDLLAWIHLSNNTGTNFLNSHLKLVSGKVVRQHQVPLAHSQVRFLSASEEHEPAIEEHEFADTHVYTIKQPVDILHGQTKQLPLFQLKEIAFRKVYRVDAFSEKAKRVIEFDNTEANQLGFPLPQGQLKVYEQDQDNEVEFVGENNIRSTTTKQKLSIAIGEAFDITSQNWEKKRVRKDHVDYVTYAYKLENQQSLYVRVEVHHSIFEQAWQMETSSHDYELIRSNEIVFRVHMAANKTVELEFTYKVDSGTK